MKAEQIRGARAMLGIKQSELANISGVSLPTIKRLEGMTGVLRIRLDTLNAIRAALESAGVEFIAENGGGAGVRLKR